MVKWSQNIADVMSISEVLLSPYHYLELVTLPWGTRDIHLYFNQHYNYAPGAFCYALSTAGTSTATGQESSTCWSLTISRRMSIARLFSLSNIL